MSASGRRVRAVLWSAALLAGGAIAYAGGPPAEELGPAPINRVGYTGRLSAVVASPTDAERYYVTGADGGVWRTTDGGQSWLPLTDQMPSSAMGALALDPTDEQILYAGSGEANFANHSRYGLGLYKSVDGGDTWTQLAAEVFAGRCFSSLAIDPGQPGVIYAGITRAGGFPEMAAAKNHPQAAGPVGLFRSTDGGQSWAPVGGGLPAVSCTSVVLDPQTPTTIYAGFGRIFGDAGNGLYKSVDGGGSWTRLTGGLPENYANTGRITVAVAAGAPQRLYAMITRAASPTGGAAGMRGAYRSDDGGATWTELGLANIQASYGWYLSVVAVHPGDPDEAYFGGLTLARTQDGGGSFATVTPPHVDIHGLAWDAAGRVLCATDGGLYRSGNGGGSWESINEGLGTVQFYAGISVDPLDPAVVAGGTQDNGSNMIRPNGSWRQVQGGDGGWTQIDQDASSVVFVEFQGTGNLFRSSDGGRVFVSAGGGLPDSDRNCFLPPYLIDPGQAQKMFYATQRIHVTFDRGRNWFALSDDITNGGEAAIRALALAGGTMWAVTNDGNVAVSRDGGLSFQTKRVDHPGWPRVTREIVCDPNSDGAVAYLAGAVYGVAHVLRTGNYGNTWQVLDGNLPDVPVNALALDRRAAAPVLYAGTDVGLYRTVDGGGHWRRWGAGFPRTAVIDLVVEGGRARLTAATQGRGIWRLPLTLPGDLDFDLDVDLTDLLALLGDYGCSGGGPVGCAGDVDGDGAVTRDDLLLLLDNFAR